MSITADGVTAEVLAALPIPDLDRLSEQQLDGHVCLWGGETLTVQTAVTVGECEHDGRRVFLRGCRTHVGRNAMGALFDHCTGDKPCTTCKASPECVTGQALNRLIQASTP
ncbi:hypothetical protein [Streptomyces sp. T028]|uniref:hypothetical protein n=1 Tax=Streptomyces sp. T028 TaxID=3394379 RepID=UPI003A8AC158